MSSYNKIFNFAKPHKKYIASGLVFNLLYSLFQIISVGAVMPVLSLMFGETKIDPTKIQNSESTSIGDSISNFKDQYLYFIQTKISEFGVSKVLFWLCVITAVTFFLRNAFRYFGSIMITYYRVNVTRDLRKTMFKKILSLPVSFFTERKKGDLMSRLSNDVGEVESNILGSLIELINAPFMIISSLVTLFIISPQLTLFTLLVLPIMGTMIAFIGKSLKKSSKEAQNELGNLFSIVDETLRSAKVIKIFSAEKIIDNRFTKSINHWLNSSVKVGKRRELASPMSEFLGSVTFLIIAWYGGIQIIENKSMQPSEFLLFLSLFFQILPPAKSLASAISNIQKGGASLERVMDILEADIKIGEVKDPVHIKSFDNQIEFKNVGFYYNEDQTILKNFNLKIPKGRTIALVGQSGSGKTTIANLLARFYDVTEGEILVDDTNIKNLKLEDYRKLIGMVTQESVLFNDSVYNNILMGNLNATKEEVEAAAKMANAHDFITQLPEGYNTNIGDDGGKLSGGQKQRVSIARAILKKPSIMILDEATSALDTKSEKYVQEALDKMMENCTSLVIAHRLSTIQKADSIIVMEKGTIMEEGTHDELLTKNGVYKKLVELQNFE